MPKIFAIETALDVCSVAIGDSNGIVILKEERGQNLHASQLGLLMEAALKESGIRPYELDAVCVSKGPGSYTGLRIGVSAAKGICFAHDLPLVSVATTLAMAYGARKKVQEETLWYCPMIDARRMEVYFGIYDENLTEAEPVQAAVLVPDLFDKILEKHKTLFFGNGMAKGNDLYKDRANARFLEDFYPSAAYLPELAEQKLAKGEMEDLFRFEPFYLKDFIAKDPGARIARVLKGH